MYDSTKVVTCDGESYTWRGRTLSADTLLRDTLSAISIFAPYEKYDSAYHILNFDFHAAAYDSIMNVSVSDEALPYNWHGEERWGASLSSDTTYVVNQLYPDESGCIDTIFTLNMHIDKVDSIITRDTICQGDTLLWRCQQLTETGIYRDTIYYESGNDSIRYKLELTVQQKMIAPIDTVIRCHDNPFDVTEWEPVAGEGYNYQRQTYYEKSGCDSVLFRMYLLVHDETKVTEQKDTICDAETYLWRIPLSEDTYKDSIYTVPQELGNKEYELTYAIRYADTTNCDSARYEMKLAVMRPENPMSPYPTDTSLCVDYNHVPTTFEWKIMQDNDRTKMIELTDAERGKTGDIYIERKDTARYTISACDSAYYLLRLHIYRAKADTTDTTATICYSDVLNWRGKDYSAEGTYRDTARFVKSGCDSAYFRLFLKVYPLPATDTIRVTKCQGAPEERIDNVLIKTDTSRVYWDSTFYPNTQCVNRYKRYEVTILEPTVMPDTTVVICHGDSYTWYRSGEVLSDTGWYQYTEPYRQIARCDSLIYNLHLIEIVLDSMPADTQYICYGQSYEWRGKTYDQTGIYRDTIKSVGDCDSMYYILVLEKQPPREYLKDTMYICGTSGEVTWPFNGKTYSGDGTYYDTLRTPQGCDLVAGELRVIIQPMTVADPEYVTIYTTQTYPWHGNVYDSPGTYDAMDKYMSGCDSVKYTLVLTVLDIDYRYVEVTDIVCAGSIYEEHGRQHVINQHTQWNDTTRTTEPGGVLVDVITQYDIDVYDVSFPQGCLNYSVASCGVALNVDSSASMLDRYIDDNPKYALVESIVWKYREGNGEWQVLNPEIALSGQVETVDIRCEVTTECGMHSVQSTLTVGKRATPETFTEYDQLPIIVKYNGTLLMIDLNAICERFNWKEGVDLHPEDVKWYQIVGELDNLSYPKPSDPSDLFMNKWGYYFTPQDDKDYYALIEAALQASVDDCGVWARTLPIVGTSPIQLQPNVSQPNGVVTINGVSECYVIIHDLYGNEVVAKTKVTGTFKAPSASGTYFVTVEDGSGTFHRTLIVYP